MPAQAIILRRARPWTLDEHGNRVALSAEWFAFICEPGYAPASVAHHPDRATLIAML